MKNDDLIILLIALLLLAGMLITIFFGGARSRHGIGLFFPGNTGGIFMTEYHQTDTAGWKTRATSFS
jgi:hypothetical protein